MTQAFIAVRARGGEAQFQPYLYDHTTLIEKLDGERFVLVTKSDDPNRTFYLAEYQAARLGSGLMGASVYATMADARKALS